MLKNLTALLSLFFFHFLSGGAGSTVCTVSKPGTPKPSKPGIHECQQQYNRQTSYMQYKYITNSARFVRQVMDRVFSFLPSAKCTGHENKKGKNEDP